MNPSLPPAYAHTSRRRAARAIVTLSLSATIFVALVSIAAARHRELGELRENLACRLPTGTAPAPRVGDSDDPPRRGRTEAGAPTLRLPRYRFAADVSARISATGTTLLRLLPAAPLPGRPPGPTEALQYELVGPPTRLLGFLRSLCDGEAPYRVDPLRLWVEGPALRAELTVRYQPNEQKAP